MAVSTHPSPTDLLTFRPEPGYPTRVRRRSTMQQGKALALLGHAIEYLVDSRLDDRLDRSAGAAEAIHLLMARSRAVFEECERVTPWQSRVSEAVASRLSWLPVKHSGTARRTDRKHLD